MNNFGSKMSGHSGDAANSLVEGYSKVDYTGTLLSVLSDLSLNRTLPALTRGL